MRFPLVILGATVLGSNALVTAPACAAGSTSVQLTIQGTVPQSCTVDASTPAIDLGDLTRAGTKDADIELSCNAPFILQLASDKGNFGAVAPPAAAGNFATTLSYRAGLSVPYDDGTSGAISDCASADLLAGATCATLASGTHTAINQVAHLALSWSAPDTAIPLLAGTYSDIIRISIEFAP